MSGSTTRRAPSRAATLASKAFTVLLSLAFAFSLVPMAAWASAGASSDAAPDAEVAVQSETTTEGEAGNGEEAAASSETVGGGEDGQDADGQPALSADSLEGDASDAAMEADGNASGDPAAAAASSAPSGAQALSSDGDAADEEQIEASIAIIGNDAAGNDELWADETTIELPEGSTAADLTEALFEQKGITASYDPDGQYGWSLESITSPHDPNVTLVAYDAATEMMWQLYINGAPSDLGAGSLTLHPGDKVVWYYSLWGDELPDESELGDDDGNSDEPAAMVAPTVSVIGKVYEGSSSHYEYWMYELPVTVTAGSDMKTVLSAAFDQLGLQYEFGTDMGSDIVKSITSPDGRTTNTGNSFVNWYVFRDGERTGWYGQLGDAVQTSEDIVLCFNISSIPDVSQDSIHARVKVVGPDANGTDTFWGQTTVTVPIEDGAQPNAWDASEAAFEALGQEYYASFSESGAHLETMTSPFTGEVLGWDDATGRYWQPFVNGKSSELGVSFDTLTEGMTVTWYYSARGATLPSDDELNRIDTTFSVVDASASDLPDVWVPEDSADATAGTKLRAYLEEQFKAAGIEADFYSNPNGSFSVNGLVSSSGKELYYESDDRQWTVFVNGEACSDPNRVIEANDSVQVQYGSADALTEVVTMQGSVIGADADGNPQEWAPATTISVYKGATGVEVAKALFAATGLEHELVVLDDSDGSGVYIKSVTSPEGEALVGAEVDPDSWMVEDGSKAWYPYVNGEGYDHILDNLGEVTDNGGALEQGHEFATGDEVLFYYSSFRSDIPSFGDEEEFPTDPDAERPDWDSSWPGFGTGAAATDAPTPTTGAEEVWKDQMKDPVTEYGTYISDPIFATDPATGTTYLYVALGDELQQRDPATGEVLKTAPLAADIDSIARMVYSDGIIVVPLTGGRLQALTADELATVWVTGALSQIEGKGAHQSLSTLTISNGCVYFATVSKPSDDGSASGYVLCVSLADGSVKWSHANSECGYYWSGAAALGDWAVIGDDNGSLTVLNATTGEVASSLDLGVQIRSSVVAGTQEGTALVASKDGVLHKLSIDAETGAVRELGAVKFASSTTSTPTVAGGKIYLTGASIEGTTNQWGATTYGGVLAVIDEASLKVERSVTTYGGGNALPTESKSTPLVSTQASGTYVYFTCNAKPGGIYLYKVGDAEAQLAYLPDEDHQEYSMTSVTCGPDGTLYYVNDSGTLFAVAPSESGFPNPPATDDGKGDDGSDGGSGNENENEIDNETQKDPSTTDDTGSNPSKTAPLILTSNPLVQNAADAVQQDAQDGEDVAVSAAAAGSAKALLADASADDAAAEEQGSVLGGLPQWLPVAGIVVGACGLAGVGLWAYRMFRREGEVR